MPDTTSTKKVAISALNSFFWVAGNLMGYRTSVNKFCFIFFNSLSMLVSLHLNLIMVRVRQSRECRGVTFIASAVWKQVSRPHHLQSSPLWHWHSTNHDWRGGGGTQRSFRVPPWPKNVKEQRQNKKTSGICLVTRLISQTTSTEGRDVSSHCLSHKTYTTLT